MPKKYGWWAHQDLNLEPTDYEFPNTTVNVCKIREIEGNIRIAKTS